MKKRFLWDLSGGSTKASGIIAKVIKALQFGLIPDIIVAVSASSLMSILIALSIYDYELRKELLRITRNIKLEDFMYKSPVTKTGKFSFHAIWSLIKSFVPFLKSSTSLGIQDLNYLLEKYVTEEAFEKYKYDSKYPVIYTASIEYNSGELKFYNLKNLTRKQAFKAIKGSSAMPFWVQGEKIGGFLNYDAGVTDQNAGAKFFKKYNHLFNFDRVLCVTPEITDKNFEDPKNQADVLKWFIFHKGAETSKGDLNSLRFECFKKGINPLVLKMKYSSNNFYEVNPEVLLEMQEGASKDAEEYISDFLKNNPNYIS